MGGRFDALDWIVMAGYFALLAVVGVVSARRMVGRDEFFLAGRRIPTWAAAVSTFATVVSAATFIGVPQQSYDGNLTYFSASLGLFAAVLIVAGVFLPAFYRHDVTTVYQLLGDVYGQGTRRAASAAYMLGRVLAGGARLYIVGLPTSLIVFGNVEPGPMAASIALITAVTAVYTAAGGIRAVIWTDVLQAVVLVGAVAAALALLLADPAHPPNEAWELLHRDAPEKLTVLDWRIDLTTQFTVWTAISGWMLLNLAAFGTDQDLVQRALTCRSSRAAGWSMINSALIGLPVTAAFLAIGLLLYARDQLPDSPGYGADDSRKVILAFVLAEVPAGLRGLIVAGLFAAAMSTLASGINSMASTAFTDFYLPWRQARGRPPDEAVERRVSRAVVVGWAVVLGGFAVLCVFWQQASGLTLIEFALGVMIYAYSGMLAVFLTALLTRRGNARSALAALLIGPAAVVGLQQVRVHEEPLAMPWVMLGATAVALLVCVAGKRGAAR